VLVGRDLEEVLASTRTLTELLAIAIPIMASVLALLVWLLVGRTLRPVEAIRASVTRIGAQSLERRVPQPAGDDEIARLAGTMNEMLDRIEAATRRQQRFVADASHELRTPVTRLRTQLEVELAHPDRADPESSYRALLEDTVTLQRLLDDLLVLARVDATALDEERVPIDLDDVVLREARRVRENGRVTVDTAAVSAASVIGEASGLARVVRNLLDNAERHAMSRVALDLGEVGDQARLLVDDDGPGIPADQRETIFQRFARLDDARSRDMGGSGLGLAIARDIVERHGGSLAVDPGYSPGARFVVLLPRAPG
jgi:signal transduction histidine kinase